MTAYMIVSLTFHNLDWAKDYLANVPDMVRHHGGEYLARSKAVEQLEGAGSAPDQVVILTFTSLDAVRTFMDCPEYAPYRDARIAATQTEILAMEA